MSQLTEIRITISNHFLLLLYMLTVPYTFLVIVYVAKVNVINPLY